MGRFKGPTDVFKQATKVMQFVATKPDPEKQRIKELLKTSTDMPAWKRRKLEMKMAGVENRWEPANKLSDGQMDMIRQLHSQAPSIHTFEALSARFRVSFEAIRRIIKSARDH